MEFRWVAFITLWTTLVGPIMGAPSGPASHFRPAAVKVVKTPAVSPAATPCR